MSGNRVMVILPGGRKQMESIHNLCPFEQTGRSAEDFIGPSRVGARISVRIADINGDSDLYTGTIRRDETVMSPEDPRGRCLVTWDDGTEPEWLTLGEEQWEFSDETSPPKLSRLPRRKKCRTGVVRGGRVEG
ncbi:hypothetical protein Pmar_PMAR001313 [Perkinsus marinus ATCC 50983]|uniref:Uncharacterized protein n=1 Tax=Perkinsus marinus (strain ATCC 50983 / TXsc) TaxID=423536 RepID=C5KQL1_PERM5|nr:hypothetical protein Pmar_PMAR001313 [Perkinsus marinus ATCC 50983]EER13232.1 hypothetical protein Pmar_PMAR001313 [Perkinsus marinus ATCC 50983]|eukprot:XP_002781437.1 hypothetical protein Pmar_PMAR001313 [Perkinsus marinus ATCC 50983]